MTIKFYNQSKILSGTGTIGEIPPTKNLISTVLKIAWPSTVESFFIALVGMIDIIMVSSLGESAVAAIGITTQPKFIGLAFFMALNISVSAIVARRRGENNPKEANKTMYNALGLTLIGTLIISLIFFFFTDDILWLVGSNEEIHEDAAQYLRIVMSFMIFQVVSITINAAQRGCGNTKVVMRSNIVSNLVNLVFNYLLIYGNFGFPALGITGAAIATVLGTVAAMIMSIVSALPGKSFVELNGINFFNFNIPTLRSIFKLAGSSLVEQVFLRFGFLVFTTIAASLGTIALAAHQIGLNIMSLSFSFADGLSIAAIALVGKSLGENRPDLAKLYGALCQRIGIIISAVLATIYFFFGTNIYGLFSDRADILSYGTIITNLISAIVLFQIAQLIYMGCLRGAGDAKYTAYISFIAIGVIRPAMSYLLVFVFEWGLIGLWLGVIVDQAARLILASARFKKGEWVKLKI